MVSKRMQKREQVYKKLQSLRSISNSTSHNKSSIILDAIKYIQELRRKMEEMNQEIVDTTTAQKSTIAQSSFKLGLEVEPREENRAGFRIKMFTQKSCRGLLVFVLEAFEELGLDVLQARVSCSDNFLLEAVAMTNKDNQNGDDSHKDAEVVRGAMLQAIQKWNEDSQ